MKKLFVISCIALSVSGCVDSKSDDKQEEKVNTENVLSEDEKKDGWKLLFDGNSTKGWHKYGDTATGSAWKVDSGILHLAAAEKENLPDRGWQIKGGGDIFTDDEFENFHLKLEWKIDTCGNSGIIIFSKEDTSKYIWGWQTGPEMQILDNKCHPDTAFVTHRAGCLYDLIAVSRETVKPALEWNKVEIKASNGKLDFWLNGENVVSTTMWDDNWKKMIANSKFKAHPDFGTLKKGRIGLQDHGNNVWFRNIKIKKL